MPEQYSFLLSLDGEIKLGPSLVSHSEIRINIEDDSKFYEVEWLEGHYPIIRADTFSQMRTLRKKLYEKFPTRNHFVQFVENIKTDEYLAVGACSYEYFINYDLDEEIKEKIFNKIAYDNIYCKLLVFVAGNYNNKARILEELKAIAESELGIYTQNNLGMLLGITKKLSDIEIINILESTKFNKVLKVTVALLRHTLPKSVREVILQGYSDEKPISLQSAISRQRAECRNITENRHPIEYVVFDTDTSSISLNSRSISTNEEISKYRLMWLPNCNPFIISNCLIICSDLLNIKVYDYVFEKIYAKFPTRDDLVKYYYEIKDFSMLAIIPEEYYKLRLVKKYSSIPQEAIEDYIMTLPLSIDFLFYAFSYLNGSDKFKKFIIEELKKSRISVYNSIGYFVSNCEKFTEEELKELYEYIKGSTARIDFIRSPIISDELRHEWLKDFYDAYNYFA